MDKTIAVTGGGTGGHLSVAKSFIEELYSQGYKVIFIGSEKGQDKAWFEDENKLFEKFFMDTRGVVNQNIFGKIISLFMILKAFIKILHIYKKYNITKVISVGGFSAAPASFAAIASGIDFYIHEQNSVMGKLNSITSKYAKELFSSYDKNSKVRDYPVLNSFFEHSRVRKEIKTIIFLGGSQGAKTINDFAVQCAPSLKKLGIDIIHQTGKNDFNRIKNNYKQLGIDVDLFDFSKDLLKKMDRSDFAVSRAGASTLWELTALGIPTLFIPYPYAAADHQYHNAKYLLENDLCFLKRENELEKAFLLEIVQKDLSDMSNALLTSIKKDSIKHMINIIMNK